MDVAWASFWECAAVAAAVVLKLFFAVAELWLQSALAAFVCAHFEGDLESWVADRSGMAA